MKADTLRNGNGIQAMEQWRREGAGRAALFDYCGTNSALFLGGEEFEAVFFADFFDKNEAIVQNSQLFFDSDVISGETVEVRNNGGLVARIGNQVHRIRFEAIEAQHAQMLNGHAIHDERLIGCLRRVEFIQRAANLAIGGALARVETGAEDLVGGIEAVREGIQARDGFAVRRSRAAITPIPSPFPTT